MLKASAPVAILMAAFIFRTKAFSWKLLGVVVLISLGVGVASYGEANLNYIGFTIQVNPSLCWNKNWAVLTKDVRFVQLVAVAVEATRVTLIQILLAGKDMSPLKRYRSSLKPVHITLGLIESWWLGSLYYFAPICLAINAVLILPIEGFAALEAIPKLGLFTILTNCTLTLLLNLSGEHRFAVLPSTPAELTWLDSVFAAVYLIAISSMVLSLSKVVKDVLLVAGSSLLLGDKLSWLQLVGYTWATIFLFVYKANA